MYWFVYASALDSVGSETVNENYMVDRQEQSERNIKIFEYRSMRWYKANEKQSEKKKKKKKTVTLLKNVEANKFIAISPLVVFRLLLWLYFIFASHFLSSIQ